MWEYQPRTEARRLLLGVISAVICLASACGSTVTGSRSNVDIGLYILDSYDGRALPATLTADNCAPMITDGVLAVTPTQNATRPLFTVDVAARSSCDETARVASVLSEAGTWDDASSSPALVSRGVVIGALGSGDATVSVAGHQYVFRFARPPGAALEKVTLSALEGSTSIDGTHFEITESDGIVSRLNTANGGPHLGAVLPGKLRVRVIPPLGFRLVAGQPNPSTYTLVSGTPLAIVVQLESTGS